MATKRKTKRATTPREDLAQPTKWRLQHGGFTAPVREADPDTGSTVVHHRAVDTLGMMLAHGTITQAMYDAGALFRSLFRRAAFDSMTHSQMIRLPSKTADVLSDRTIDARRKVAEALDVLGGHDSAAGSCAWYVLGLETSVREWAMRQGWGGRQVAPPQAQGMLVATLSVLAAYFGLVQRTRAA